MVLGTAGELWSCEGREAVQVGGGEVQGVEPVDCAFVCSAEIV